MDKVNAAACFPKHTDDSDSDWLDHLSVEPSSDIDHDDDGCDTGSEAGQKVFRAVWHHGKEKLLFDMEMSHEVGPIRGQANMALVPYEAGSENTLRR